MKKLLLFGLLFLLVCSGGFLLLSAEENPLTYEEYFAEERGLKRYSSFEKSNAYKRYTYISTDYYASIYLWEENFSIKPEADWLYITPLNGTKYEPLVKLNQQGYAFMLDTLYYVNTEGWIVALDLVNKTEEKIVKTEGPVEAMEVSGDLIFYQSGRKLYRVYLPEKKTDFFMDMGKFHPNKGWTAFSNQSVEVYLGKQEVYYNRETDSYYSSIGPKNFFLIARGEESKIPSAITLERVPFETESILFNYSHIIRMIPEASYTGGFATHASIYAMRSSSGYTHMESNFDILLQELMYAEELSLYDKKMHADAEAPDALQFSVETVRQVYENTFGPGYFSDVEREPSLSSIYGTLVYDPEQGCYKYDSGKSYFREHDSILRVAYTGVSSSDNEIVLEVRYGRMSLSVKSNVRLFSGNELLTSQKYAKAFCIIPEIDDPENNPNSAYNLVQSGYYDPYFPSTR